MSEKVANFDEMVGQLAELDPFGLSGTPSFEHRRGPAIPTYVAAARTPLLFLPVRSGPDAAIRAWMEALDGAPVQQAFTQGSLRRWKAARPGHRSFTVLRHPLARAHAAFCDRILSRGAGSFPQIRQNLIRTFGLELPEDPADPGYGPAEHRAAFSIFLSFLKANLSGQTGIRIDPAWASQAALLEGMSGFAPPDMILREEDLAGGLAHLCREVGRTDVPEVGPGDPHRDRLAQIVTAELQGQARDAMARDYMSFGFDDWR